MPIKLKRRAPTASKTVQQLNLFDPEHYPRNAFKPLHDEFRGKALVPQHGFDTDAAPFEVDLNSGECKCLHGAAWSWFSGKSPSGSVSHKWVPNRYCVHKLKAIADIIQQRELENDSGVMFAFAKAVATRYNQFESVSAFHKYLRLGKVDRAYFFACIVCTTRGAKGIIKYLLAIVYEESRDHDLRTHLSKLMEQPTKISFLDMARAIQWFCETKKKWDLHEVRIPLFYHEMRGYQRLTKDFGFDVAKASEIIDSDMVDLFLKGIPVAIKNQDWDKLQYCIKGIQKSKFPDGVKDLHQLRMRAIEVIAKAVPLHWTEYRKAVRKREFETFLAYLRDKPADIGISYHDLNAFADLIAGEPYGYGILPPERQKQILAIKKLPVFPFEKFPSIPIFAHDNHTWRGKALLRQFAGQIPFGIEQSGFDLRGCGAYHGVNWRYHAAAQGGIKKLEWDEVKAPKWIADFTLNMFY